MLGKSGRRIEVANLCPSGRQLSRANNGGRHWERGGREQKTCLYRNGKEQKKDQKVLGCLQKTQYLKHEMPDWCRARYYVGMQDSGETNS